jgi:DNA-directed RNA polymerase subunit RPC12/RpoP
MAWETKTKIGGLPLISIGAAPLGVIAIGVNGAGILYIGWIGGGFISITQFGVGFISIAQMGVGVFSLGQLAVGIFTLGQLALGLVYSIGQAALGFIAVGYGGSCGYYEFEGKGNILTDIRLSIESVKESPEPLIYWSVIWGILILFVTLNWEKLRHGWRFLDFFRPLSRHSRYKARLEAVDEMTDQEDLENMGKYDPHPKVRVAAIKKIRSLDVLREIAGSRTKPSVRLAAVDKLSDDISLKNIVMRDAPGSVKRAAVKKINDEDILLEILSNAPDAGIKKEAAEKINDEKKLANIALTAESERARVLAAKKISDYDTLVKIRDNEDGKSPVRKEAEKKLKKFKPRYSFVSVKLDCPNCRQPVFPGGPLLGPECSYCFNKVTLTEKFWIDILENPFVHEEYQVLGSNTHSEKGEKVPRCLKCGKKLRIPGEKVGTVHSVKCSSCGYQNPSYPAPDWLKKLRGLRNRKKVSGSPVQVYCAWHEDSEVTKRLEDIKPVAVACVQCGGTLKITVDTPRNAECPYCGTSQYLPDPLWRILHPVSQKHTWYIRWSPLLRKE